MIANDSVSHAEANLVCGNQVCTDGTSVFDKHAAQQCLNLRSTRTLDEPGTRLQHHCDNFKPSTILSVFTHGLGFFIGVVITASVFYNGRSSRSFSATNFPAIQPGNHGVPNSVTEADRTTSLRKRSSCASGGIANADDYNLPLHVGALFIILFVSFVACALPILASKFPRLRVPAAFFFGIRHFGTGVLLATAFVHLLPTAFTSLGNPCLSSFWIEDYPAMPGAIALAGVFCVAIIEMVFHPARRISPPLAHGQEDKQSNPQPQGTAQVDGVPDQHSIPSSFTRPHGQTMPVRDLSRSCPNQDCPGTNVTLTNPSGADFLLSVDVHRKAILQCVLLEVGILFHSVFIGMALSVSIGNEFIVLLVAICFHQTFEGLGLGSRIAAIHWPKGEWQPWWMAVAYGCTTPIGQAIGIATHSLYTPDSEVGLVLVGVTNAISAGLLIFASLIELLAEDFLTDQSWETLRGNRRIYACLIVLAGAIAMSLVGAWA